jgi:hypothetical protein
LRWTVAQIGSGVAGVALTLFAGVQPFREARARSRDSGSGKRTPFRDRFGATVLAAPQRRS